jgi:type IV secretion system protein TrbL
VFQAGINIVTTIWNNYHGFWGTLEMIPVMLAAIPVVIAFSFAAIFMLMILIESYFIFGLAALLLAFGGLRWSRNIATGLLFACVAVGFKLLAIEALAPLATQLITQIANSSAGLNFQGIFTVLGVGIAFATLAKMIPDRIERIVLGSHYSYAHPSQPIREAATTGAVLVGAAALSGGSIALAVQAITKAIEQQNQNSQQGGQPSLPGGGLRVASGVVGAMASAAGSEISGRLGGLYRGGPGASAVRMANQVAQSRRVAAAEAARPQPPQPPAGGTGTP